MSDVEPGSFHPFEVSATHIIYVGLGVFVALFGMFSLFIKEKLYLGEAPIAAIFGIIVGPVALNLFDPSNWGGHKTDTPGGHITNEITLEVMRVTIALSVFAVGVELPKKYLLRHWRSIALLLGPVMVWGWLVTAAFMYALVPGLDFLNCLVVASCVTPTDPILAQAVVGGPWAEKHVPAHLRHMLMCESGCNDGAAFPFLYLALFLTTNRDNHGKAIAEWFYDAWAYQIIFGTLLGALIGWAARKLMRFSERHKLVDRESFVAQYVSLAVASMGVNVLLGSDDLLAAFACGTAFAWDGWFTKQTEDSNFSSIVDLLFNVATFIYIGALMPFHDFVGGSDAERNTLSLWRLFVLAICVLLTKRLPIVVALWRWIPDIKTFREAVFAGHFGPIGVGAIFIATLARTLLPEEVASPPETTNDYLALTVQPIIFFFVLCSIIIHGLTIPFFAFSRRATTMTRTWSRH
ncbi:Sodium/hydrogen exchanger, partial [Acaromyces ingoldii]